MFVFIRQWNYRLRYGAAVEDLLLAVIDNISVINITVLCIAASVRQGAEGSRPSG